MLAGSARKKYSVGEIVNFMAVDAQRVSEACFVMHNIWSAQVQIIGMQRVYIMYKPVAKIDLDKSYLTNSI